MTDPNGGFPPPPGSPNPYGGPPPANASLASAEAPSLGEGLSWSFAALRANLGGLASVAALALAPMVLAAIIYFVGIAIAAGSSTTDVYGTVETSTGGGLALLLASLLALIVAVIGTLLASAALTRAAHHVAQGRAVSIKSSLANISWGKVVIAALILFGLSLIGAVALCVGSLVVSGLTPTYMALVLDEDRDFSGTSALKQVWEWLTAGNWVAILLGGLVAGFVAGLGVYLCVVGIVVTLPFSSLYGVYVARRLGGQSVTSYA